MKKIYFIGKTSGSSMKPLINDGDKLYVIRPQVNDLQVGDIIIFYDRKNFISHRLIKKTKKFLIAKGDNTPFYDNPLLFTQVLGKLVKIEGKYKTITTDSMLWQFSKFYFVFFSMSTYFATRLVYRIISFIFFGRHLLTSWLGEKNK